MKVAIYSPYLDTFGGGERYMLTLAEVISDFAKTDLLLDKNLYSKRADKLKGDLSKHFGLDLSKVKVIKAPIGKGSNPLQRTLFLMRYDLFFYLTDGSIFYPSSKKNILHIQSPIKGQPAQNRWGKIKLKAWDFIIYNSKFTQDESKKNWPLDSKVIYPPVDIEKIKPLKKKNYILSVGRFFGYLQSKKHEIMIDAFSDLFKNKMIDNWTLYLVGGSLEGDKPYLEKLKKMAKDLPIQFYPNLDYNSLVKLYGEASIYWHSTGFEENDPTKMEHFGISVVEAMAGGCIPVIINKGGLREIVNHNHNGYLWNSLAELKNLTLNLINDRNLRDNLSKKAQDRAKDFSKARFKEKIINIIRS